MRVLIVDCRAQSTRRIELRRLLVAAGHSVTLAGEVGGRRADNKAAASRLAARHDAILLHASPEQSLAFWALSDPSCYRNKPTLLFSGGSILPDFASELEANPLHACLPFPAPPDPEPDWCNHQGNLVVRMLDAIATGQSGNFAPADSLDARLARLYELLHAGGFENPETFEQLIGLRKELLDRPRE